MLGIDPHAARATWTAFLIALIIFIVWLARETIVVFALALFFAYMLSPVVNIVQRFSPPKLSRNASLAIVYILLVGALVGVGIGIGSAVADQAANLTEELPKLIESQDPFAAIPLPRALDPLRDRITAAVRPQLANLDKEAFPLIRRAATEVVAHASTLLFVVLIPILIFFFLKDGASMRDTFVAWTTGGSDSILLDKIFDDIHALLGHYIRALVILSAATFVCYTVFLESTGARYSVLLGGIAAILEFIPVIGPLAAVVIIVVVQAFSGYPHLLWVLIFIVIYRLFQDYVLSPYLMGSGVELHPLLVLFGVLAGEQIAGVPGMFFSVPVIATLRVVYVRIERARASRELASRPI
jgi:predicted PurR-regulated permease PerM